MITLKTLPQATALEVYLQCREHLLKQNKQSKRILIDDVEDCAYRGENGLKCAAGCFIADDEYVPEMDTNGEGWTDSTWNTLVKYELVPPDHHRLIRDLQKVHDLSEPSLWPSKLDELAVKYGFSLS